MKPNFKVLDGLRGIAALYVVINHCRGNMLMGGSEFSKIVPISDWSIWDKLYFAGLQFTSLGTEFVVLFFVLSGFSIAHSLKTNTSVLGFYKRRLIRIYPPFIAALFWAFAVFSIVKSSSLIAEDSQSVFNSWISTISNFFYIPNGDLIPQFWSLSHEVIFYLLAPFALIKKSFSNLFIAIICGLYVSSYIFAQNQQAGTFIIDRFFFDYGVFFVLGILLYRAMPKEKLITLLRGKGILILAVIILIPLMVILKYKLGEDNRITPLISALLSIILILNFLHYNFNWNWLTAIGRMSYSLYITHFASIYLLLFVFVQFGWIESGSTQNWFIWILGVFGCLILTLPFYYLTEKPTKKILAKLRHQNHEN